MLRLNLNKKTVTYRANLSAYSMVLEITSSQDIEKEVFVKQKLVNFTNDTPDEFFVAVCSPVQMSDLPVNIPTAYSSYFRVSKVELIAGTQEELKAIFNSITFELQKLIVDLEAQQSLLEIEENYEITDTGVNIAPVVVLDTVPPVVSLIGASTISLNVGDIFSDPGATVSDNVDATHSITGTGLVDTSTAGTYTRTYRALDAAGNVATPVTRSVIVNDVVAPVITLIGANTVNLNVGDVFTDAGANVTDDVDAARVILGAGTVNAAAPGTYVLTYSATDAAGNIATSVNRNVVVSAVPPPPDIVAPVITLIGTNPITLNEGDTFSDPGATVSDDIDVDYNISGVGAVFTNTPGTYTLTYSASDAAGNVATQVTRNVVVNAVSSFAIWSGSSSVGYNYGSKVTHNGKYYIAVQDNFANYEPGVALTHWQEVNNSINVNVVVITGVAGGSLYNDYGVSDATDLNGAYVETTNAVGFVAAAVNGPNYYKIGNGGTQTDGTLYLCAPDGKSNYLSDQTWNHWTLSYLQDNRFDYLKNPSGRHLVFPTTNDWQVFCPNSWDSPYAANIDISNMQFTKIEYQASSGTVTVT